jgi:hypothetical protein
LSTRLPTSLPKPPRRVDNPPQVDNLPHIRQRARLNQHRCPLAGKPSGIAHSCVPHPDSSGCPAVADPCRRIPARYTSGLARCSAAAGTPGPDNSIRTAQADAAFPSEMAPASVPNCQSPRFHAARNPRVRKILLPRFFRQSCVFRYCLPTKKGYSMGDCAPTTGGLLNV